MSLTNSLGAQPAAGPPLFPDRLDFRLVVGFLIFVEFLSGLLQGFFSPLIPSLVPMLDVNVGMLNWAMSLSGLTIGAIPILAALGDRFGHRRVLTIAIWTVAVGVLLCAVAPSWPLFALGNALWTAQGVWIALQVALVRDKATGVVADRAVSLLAGALTGGGVLGSLVSGPVLSLLGSPRLVLVIPVVLAVLCALMTMLFVPESTTRIARPIDWIGAIGLSVVLVSLLLGLLVGNRVGWTATATWTCLAIFLASLSAWVVWEHRSSSPLMDIRLITSRTMWPAMLTTLLFGMIFFGARTPMLTFLAAEPDAVGYGLGFSPSSISVVVALFYVAGTLGSVLCAALAGKIGMRVILVLGAGLCATGVATMAVLPSVAAFQNMQWLIVPAWILDGLGVGLLLSGLSTYISGLAPHGQVAVVTSTFTILRNVGGSIATAVVGVLLLRFTPVGSTAPTVTGYSVSWFICAGAGVLGLLVMMAVWTIRRRDSAASQRHGNTAAVSSSASPDEGAV